MIAAKEFAMVPTHMTNTSTTHTDRAMGTTRARYGPSSAGSKPSSNPVTTNSVRNTKALANAVCAVCNSLPATMVPASPEADMRCQFRPSCSPAALWAVKAPMTKGMKSIDDINEPCPQMTAQVAPWAKNSARYSMKWAYPESRPTAHSRASAGQYQRFETLRFSHSQAARTEGRSRGGFRCPVGRRSNVVVLIGDSPCI